MATKTMNLIEVQEFRDQVAALDFSRLSDGYGELTPAGVLTAAYIAQRLKKPPFRVMEGEEAQALDRYCHMLAKGAHTPATFFETHRKASRIIGAWVQAQLCEQCESVIAAAFSFAK